MKNESSFQRYNDSIAEIEAVYQPPAETTSAESTQPSQKRQAENQWIAARGIVLRDMMVQQKVFRCYVTYPHFPPPPHPPPSVSPIS